LNAIILKSKGSLNRASAPFSVSGTREKEECDLRHNCIAAYDDERIVEAVERIDWFCRLK
jgi:hypothetical protein